MRGMMPSERLLDGLSGEDEGMPLRPGYPDIVRLPEVGKKFTEQRGVRSAP